jgi:hypothetical protein
MLSQRWRPVWYSVFGVLLIWTAAFTGINVAKNSRPTAERVREFVESVDLDKLSLSDRERKIQTLANKLNALPPDERRRAQFERLPRAWFEQMTEEEKRQFLEATTPKGFIQMLAAFEKLPEERRRRTIEDTARRLRDVQTRLQTEGLTNSLPPLSGDLLARIRTMGLVELYQQSPAQTKAELAPILEELQRVMESGRPFRGR